MTDKEQELRDNLEIQKSLAAYLAQKDGVLGLLYQDSRIATKYMKLALSLLSPKPVKVRISKKWIATKVSEAGYTLSRKTCLEVADDIITLIIKDNPGIKFEEV